MTTNSQAQSASCEGVGSASAEQRLKALGITLPAPPEPFGFYAEVVRTGNLLFLSGMLPTEGREAAVIGRVGAELDVEAGQRAEYLAALNVLAVARKHLGSLDRVMCGSSGSVCLWLLSETSAINRKSLTLLRRFCKTCSEKTRTRADWCMASQVFPSVRPSNWKSFSRWRRKKDWR